MHKRSIPLAGSLLAIAAVAMACGSDGPTHGHGHAAPQGDTNQPAILASVRHAICVLAPTAGNTAAGWVKFVEADDGTVAITGEISGLTPNGQHAIHIHEFGDMSSADGMATGSHYNPEGHPHGLPDQAERHAGDFGNLHANAEGVATINLNVDNLSMGGEKNPILGRAIIVHAKPDDGSQPVGNAGARITQGVIGVMKNPE